MVEHQLRPPTSRTRACSTRWHACPGTSSSPRSSAPAPTTTRPCPSAPARRSRSRTWSPASARRSRCTGSERVLDVGTGSGYQAAVLAELAAEVHTIERLPQLAEAARDRLASAGYDGRVHVHVGDGTLGLLEQAPFDAIAVAAAAPELPASLYEQLQPRGRLVVPVGRRQGQQLQLIVRSPEGPAIVRSVSCRFVPLLGEEGFAV